MNKTGVKISSGRCMYCGAKTSFGATVCTFHRDLLLLDVRS